MVLKRFGYYFMLTAFVLWVMALGRLWSRRTAGKGPSGREWMHAALLIGLVTCVAVNSEPFQSKVLYDEFVLQSTAYNMHHFRDASAMVRGYDLLGVFTSLDTYLDKRPNFFPFLVSLVHDLTGYRAANAYRLNACLLPVALGLAYYLGRRLNDARGGLLAVLALGSLPLLLQNATGSGMELLNVVMLLTVIGLAGAYLRQPDEAHLGALALGAVLLAQTRYESVLYIGPVAAIILIGWWIRRAVVMPAVALLAPLLLVPAALQNRVVSGSRWMWELKDHQDTRFSIDYLGDNLRGIRTFLFNTDFQLANSWPLAAGGLLSLGYIFWRLVRIKLRAALVQENSDRIVWVLCGLGILANFILLMFYYWANLADPIASRLSLPLHLVLVFALVVAAMRLDRHMPASWVLLGAMGLFGLGVTTGHAAKHIYSHLGIDEIEWGKRFVAARPPGARLIISNTSTMPWLLEKTSSILIDRARHVSDRLHYQLERGTFTEILVFQSLRPVTREGDHQLIPEDRLPPGYEMELLIEKRFGTKIIQVSRLVAVKLPPAGASLQVALP